MVIREEYREVEEEDLIGANQVISIIKRVAYTYTYLPMLN